MNEPEGGGRHARPHTRRRLAVRGRWLRTGTGASCRGPRRLGKTAAPAAARGAPATGSSPGNGFHENKIGRQRDGQDHQSCFPFRRHTHRHEPSPIRFTRISVKKIIWFSGVVNMTKAGSRMGWGFLLCAVTICQDLNICLCEERSDAASSNSGCSGVLRSAHKNGSVATRVNGYSEFAGHGATSAGATSSLTTVENPGQGLEVELFQACHYVVRSCEYGGG